MDAEVIVEKSDPIYDETTERVKFEVVRVCISYMYSQYRLGTMKTFVLRRVSARCVTSAAFVMS